jgi:phenylpropionate dioxygenase-like ring-hydroxylating dioxygenase large terminal subunit
MEHDEQVRIVRAILRHIEAGTTDLADEIFLNPVSSYTSAAQLELEWQRLFRGMPLLVGLSCQIPKAGGWLTDDFAPTPILVVRTASGEARAFANVCRHRGAKIAAGSGRDARCFVCPYHAWRYELDGRLGAIPDEYGFEGIDRDEYALRPLPIAERDGLLWVLPTTGGTIDLDAHLGVLSRELSAYRFGEYHYYTTRVIRRRMNWKLVVDTFGEAYHLKPLHRATVGHIYHQNVEVCRSHGLSHSMTLARRTIEHLRGSPETTWNLIPHAAVVYVLFPNVVFTVQGDHIDVLRVYPVDGRVDECVMYVDWYIPEPATTEKAVRHWEKNVDLFVRTVNDEDFAVGEEIQRGFASGAQTHLTYGRYEVPLQHYHHALRAALAEEGGAAPP